MSFATLPGVLEVIAFVSSLAPQLADDAASLGALFSHAAAAVDNAAPDGTVQPGDWTTLLSLETQLRATLDKEAAAANTEEGIGGTG